MFNQGLTDSLKIRIKLDKIKVLDKRLISDYIEYYPNIEQLDNDLEQQLLGDNLQKAKPLVKIINGITYRFYVKAFIDKRKTAQEYLVLQVSAKMLKQRYFEGITKDNIGLILADINSFKIIRIEKKDLLDGLVSDIDICINQLIDEKSLKIAFSLIHNFPRPSKKPLMHFISQKNHKGEKNLGVDFNKREKATNGAPYCKIYHKGHELLSKSKDFYKAYLEPMKRSILDNLVRYEFTIKASKHKQYLCKQGYKADFKTLGELLEMSPKDLADIAKSGLKHYVEKPTKSKVNTDLSPTDIMLQYYIEQLIKVGFDSEKLLGFQYSIDCPVAKSRSKTKAKNLIKGLGTLDGLLNVKLLENDRAGEFLNNIGLSI
ncbi:hypothetical protein [uncultured Flavobacterium sp.]|uniref:hypothetical protein n=1 Tax=uncultured Flavobacterium sp. TaxID=165435 RepID=UPI0027DFD7FB|nr:hypothetical protein [uncultured Flavobacterium sp.]